jgi:DNA polymerase I
LQVLRQDLQRKLPLRFERLSMPPTLYLIDGHALAYRAYFALTRGSSSSTFTTSSGEPTAGVFGFTSVLLRILEQENPDYLAVAFDTGRTFRDELFPDYKGTREKMPDELRTQIERMREMVDAFNIPRLELENYEADDVLGSVARQAVAKGLGVKIFTGDRDLLQLVDERIIVNLPGRSLSDARDYLPSDVKEYLGVRPDQVVDYKALVGDKSDNIPGVPGIGEKTAISLLEQYDTLDSIYQHLEEITGSAGKKLETGRDSAYLSKKLATIVTDLVVPLDLEHARPDHFEPERIEAIFRELEFRSLMTRLTALEENYGKRITKSGQQLSLFEQPTLVGAPAVPEAVANDSIRTVIVNTSSTLADLVHELERAEIISFDTETTSTDQMSADLVGISLATDTEVGYYIPVGHSGSNIPQLPLAQVIEALKGVMTDPRIPKAGHNLKYDFVMLARNGLRVAPLTFDSMIAEWVINPNSRNLGLKNLAWIRKDIRMTHIEELIGRGKKQITMAKVPAEEAAPYAALDAAVVLNLLPELKEELDSHHGTRLYETIEMPLISVLADMEMAGIALDVNYLQRMSQELNARLSEIEQKVYQSVGEPFNLNSPQQLSEALFNRLKLEPPDRSAKTSTGFYSTSADVLEALRDKHEAVNWVLEYRELSKLLSTYVDALPAEVNNHTSRVHTSFNQTGAVTGRIASSDPNLQNIPIRTEIGRQVRNAFIADEGNFLLSVDYSQIELRIVAHMADDQAMLAAFRAGQDIHAATAAAIFGVPIEAVSKEQRRRAKGINFGLIYGMSAYGLTRYTDLTLAESEDFMEAYFRQFPGVKRYLDDMRKSAADQGYVETLLGRRRYFPGLKNQSNRNIRNREEREAINAPIQGTAADIMKIAMLRVPPALRESGLSSRMLLQVHDELVLECPQEELHKTAAIVQKVMEGAYNMKVPLRTEARYGTNWGEMIPLS